MSFSIKRPASFYPYLILTLGVLSIAFSALFIRWAQAPGVISSFYRMAIGALIMALPFLYQSRRKPGNLPRRGVLLAVLGGIFFSLDMFFWSTGIVMSGATNPTLLANTAPLWVGLGSWLIFKERQSSVFWVGLILAISGAVLVLGQDLMRSTAFGQGTLFGVFSAFFYGGFHLASQRGRVYLNTLAYFWISTFVSALFLLVYALLLGHPLLGYDAQTWLLFLVMGVLVQCLGWMFINYAQGHIPAAIVAPTLLAQPVMTAILSSIFLGETFTTWHLLGGGLVLVGVFTVHRSRAM